MTTNVLVLLALGAFVVLLWVSEWFRRGRPDRSRDAKPEDDRYGPDANGVPGSFDGSDVD